MGPGNRRILCAETRSPVKNLPPLTDVTDKGGESNVEFGRLIKKLLIHDGALKGYKIESASAYRDEGIAGIVRKKYPGMECPVIFQSKWVKGQINVGNTGKEIKTSIERICRAGLEFKSYVLVTPRDLTNTEKEWLQNFTPHLHLNFHIYYYGHSKIQELLTGYPAMQKYFYGSYEYPQDPGRDFIALEKQYRRRVFDERKDLNFFGLPTGSYQQQYNLQKPELSKLYIPLEFHRKRDDTDTITLDDIIKESLHAVVLGGPGCGKTTLVNYLALLHIKKPGGKIPFIIPIRDWVRKKSEKSPSFDFINYLKYTAEENYNFAVMDNDFFIALLELGKAVVVFDGLDEAVSEEDRIKAARAIEDFSHRYPDALIWVTSRIMGYTAPIILNPRQFDLYYLAPVNMRQTRTFIKKWYEIQVPINKTYRNERIRSLLHAIAENPEVKQLCSNPLLLTIMTLIHQFEGTLPDNRVKLYEKCVELLLKTWQEQKYINLGIQNPLEEKGLKYDVQLKLLAAAAFYFLERAIKKTVINPGVIEEKELVSAFLKTRFDKKRITIRKAKEDVRVFIDYIRGRAGLLVEKGRNQKGENLFAFAHLSFFEYLAAYHMAEDRNKSQTEHIRRLLQFFGDPICFEPILLALQIFARSTGLPFIDAFIDKAFTKLSNESNPNGWFLLGRAVRDNINFARDDIKRIIREIVDIWMKDHEGSNAFPILKDIVHFSDQGKRILKQVIKENIKINAAANAFKALCFYKKFYRIDSSLTEIIPGNKDISNLLPYLPVYRKSNILNRYILENLGLHHWVIYFNSAADKTLENIQGLPQSNCSPLELKAYLLSSWHRIINTFQHRRRFLDSIENGAGGKEEVNAFIFNFANYADAGYPLHLFRPFMTTPVNVTAPFIIKDQRFIAEDKIYSNPVDKCLVPWIDKTVKSVLSAFKNNAGLDLHRGLPGQTGLSSGMKCLGECFLRDFLRCLKRNPIQHFLQETMKGTSREFLRRFIRSLNRYLTGDFIQGFLQGFNRHLIQNLDRGALLKFGKEFIKYIKPDYLEAFTRDFIDERIRDLNPSFKDEISHFYRQKYHRELKRDNLSGEDFERLYNLYMDGFNKNKPKIIDAFYSHLYEYLFCTQFEVSFNSPGSPDRVTMSTPMIIPFTFGFWLISALDRYLINILWNLHTRFFKHEELNIDTILRAIDEYRAKHPFVLYLLDFSREFYAKDFYQSYREQSDNESDNLRLAAFIVNAAKISLSTGYPCKGSEWEKIIKEAEKKSPSDIFVHISLTLYKLSNFQEIEENSTSLKNLLERLKRDFPSEYRLLL